MIRNVPTSQDFHDAGVEFSMMAYSTIMDLLVVFEEFEHLDDENKLSKQQGKVIEEVHRSVMIGLKIQHGHELRRKYEEAKEADDDQKRTYWHFIWRFETLDFMGL